MIWVRFFADLEGLCVDINQRYQIFYGEEAPPFMKALKIIRRKWNRRFRPILNNYSALTVDGMKNQLGRRGEMEDMVKQVVGLDDSMMYIHSFFGLANYPIESAQLDGGRDRIQE